ncbi:MAG TPA: sugar ABC transporter ATP-binding protein [Bauldia sp.]|nr:sugar ABC transporter ATP-binding protein [Bauldia sp.]
MTEIAATQGRGEFVYEVRNIAKSFGGTQALKGVSIGFRPGEVHAIMGENGAGKSTLVKILCGFFPTGRYSGELILNSIPIRVDSIHDAESRGILLVPQDLQVVAELTVADNLFLNREPSRRGMVQNDVLWPKAVEFLRDFGLAIDPTRRMGDLLPAEQQLVLIARGMMRGVCVLALDEPTAALTDAEAQILFRHIERLSAKGIAIIYISHRIDEITRIAEVVTVLRDGLVVDQLRRGEPSETGRRIIRAMVGRDIDLNRRTPTVIGETALSVEDITVVDANSRERVSGLSLDVRRGEVVGVFGSVGCGADEFVRALVGTTPRPPTGTIRIDGRSISLRRPADALRAGIGYLPGDRQGDGVFPLLSVGENIAVLTLDRMTRGPMISPAREAVLVYDFFEKLHIKAASVNQGINTLSGGNQQKAMLARVLTRNPKILVLHNPTQGVDIATKQELYGLIDRLAHEGKAILIVSSDLEEVIVLSDRVLALRQGRLAGGWSRADATQHAVLAAATGGH